MANTSFEQLFFTALKNGQVPVRSAYDVWLSIGNVGTPQDFIDSLRGKSAYEIWLTIDGNEGKTEAQFLESIGGITDDEFNAEVTARTDGDTKALSDAKAYTDEKVSALSKTVATTTNLNTEINARTAGDTKALSDAKAYTDSKVETLTNSTTNNLNAEITARTSGDSQTLTSSKSYTDQKIAALGDQVTFTLQGNTLIITPVTK